MIDSNVSMIRTPRRRGAPRPKLGHSARMRKYFPNLAQVGLRVLLIFNTERYSSLEIFLSPLEYHATIYHYQYDIRTVRGNEVEIQDGSGRQEPLLFPQLKHIILGTSRY